MRPGDPEEARAVAAFCSRYEGPCYIRLGKSGEPLVHTTQLKLSIGKIIKIEENQDIAIFSTGAMLKYVFDFVHVNKICSSVYSFPFVKPIDLEALAGIVQKHKKIITIEEHQAQAGFGSAILEAVNDLYNSNNIMQFPVIKRVAIPGQFYSVAGSQQYLRELAG